MWAPPSPASGPWPATARCSSWGSAPGAWPSRWPRPGCQTWGVDASAAMLARLRVKPGADGLRIVQADMAAPPWPRRVASPSSSAPSTRSSTFTSLATRRPVWPGAPTPWPRMDGWRSRPSCLPKATSAPEGPVSVRSIESDRVVLSVTERDVEAQTVTGQLVDLSAAGVRLRPYRIRYLFPAQLDDLAAEVGLRLVDRWASWDGEPVHRRQPPPRVGLRPGMNELRWNPLAGQWVTIATERAARPIGLRPPLPARRGRARPPLPLLPGPRGRLPARPRVLRP